MAMMEGADGFQWENNIGTKDKPLAGDVRREWWREAQISPPYQWWRITKESGELEYFLRLWELDKDTDKVVQKAAGSHHSTLSPALRNVHANTKSSE